MVDEKVPPSGVVSLPPRKTLDDGAIQTGERLGSGGQAAVYEAHIPDTDLDRFVLREARKKWTLSRDAISAFTERSRMWALVDSRQRNEPRWSDLQFNYIVGVIDYGEDSPWVALEHIGGGSLDNRLDASPDDLPIDQALWIIECICRGLHVAHQSGVAHLDIKPSNILLRKTPSDKWNIPALTDWGVARRLAETKESIEGFSPCYAAPEQFEQLTFGEQDTITDVYQVGCTLHALLTGDPPITGSRLEIKNAVLSEKVPSLPSDDRPEVPSEVDQIVSKSLERNKSNRYGSIDRLLQAVVRIRQNFSKSDTTSNEQNGEKTFKQRVEEIRAHGDGDSDNSSSTVTAERSDKRESFKQRVEEIRAQKSANQSSSSDDIPSDQTVEKKPFKQRIENIRAQKMTKKSKSPSDAKSDQSSDGKSFKQRVEEIRNRRGSDERSSAEGTMSKSSDEENSSNDRGETIHTKWEDSVDPYDKNLATWLTQNLANGPSGSTDETQLSWQSTGLDAIQFQRPNSTQLTNSSGFTNGESDINADLMENYLLWCCENSLEEPVENIESQRQFEQRVAALTANTNLPTDGQLERTVYTFVYQYEDQYGENHVQTKMSRFTVLKFLKNSSFSK